MALPCCRDRDYIIITVFLMCYGNAGVTAVLLVSPEKKYKVY